MAAPTSTNEVTARRLTRLLVGSDGNGGLWKKVGDKVTNAIGALDVASAGGAGKYISAISETDGKISATATSMDTAPTASSTNAVTSGGVKTALDGKASSTHTHGNIQNGGTLQTNDITIANGDKLVVTDASDSNKVARTNIAFDGSTTDYFLTKKGTLGVVKEADVYWGGNFRTYLSPIEWGNMLRNLIANPLPAAIKFEKTTNGGTTWSEVTVSDENKKALFNLAEGSSSFSIANSAYSGISDSTLIRGRITITGLSDFSTTSLATNTWFYGQAKRILLKCSRTGTGNCTVELQSGPNFVAKNDTWEVLGTYNIAGDTGWNSIPIDTTLGGYSGQLETRYVAIRFTFWTNAAVSTARIAVTALGILPETVWKSRASQIATYGVPIGIYNDGTGVVQRAKQLETARKLSVNLANTSTDSTFDGSADQTGIKVSGTLGVANGGTGKTSVTANSYLKGNGTGALVERTYAEVRSDLGISAGANKVEASTTNGKIKIDGTETTVYTHPSQTAQSAKGSATKVPQITTDSTGHVTGITEVTITGVTPASHTHGNITNGGSLQTNDVTIASGDKLVITDSSDSSKVARASISFDGSTATKALTQKGTWETFNNYTHPTTSGNKHVPSGGSSGQFLGWDSDGTAKWVANPNTDTKVTAVGNHYTPSGGTSKDASGGTATQLPTSSTGTLTQVVTGVTVDAAGHVTGVSSKGLWSPNNTYNFSGTTFYSGNQSNAEHNANNISANGVYYWTSNGPTTTLGWTPMSGTSDTDGAIYAQAYSSSWVGQIAQDYRNGNLAVRGKNNGTWTPWNRIVDQQAFASGTGVNLVASLRIKGASATFTTAAPTDLVSGWAATHNGATNDSYIRVIATEDITVGDTYTLSLDIEGLNESGNEYIEFYNYDLTGNRHYRISKNGRTTHTFINSGSAAITAGSTFTMFDDSPTFGSTAPSGFTIKNVKLERGSIATPYSRHPSEDQTKVYYVEGPNTFTAYSSSSTYTKWASGDAYTSSNSCQYNGVAYYCSTAITTAEAWNSSHWTQVPTVDWTGTIPGLTALYTGLKIAYKIPSTRGGSSSTRLNINGLGPAIVYRNTGNTTSHLPAGTIVNLTYDGTYWKWADYADGNDWVTSMGAYCTTASSTQAKAATSYGTVYTAGETFLIRFSNSNTYDGKITLNINSQGAKDVWINGVVSSSSNKTLPAGEHWCHYDGSKFLIWTDGTAQFTKLKASATDFPVMTDQEVTDLLGAMSA